MIQKQKHQELMRVEHLKKYYPISRGALKKTVGYVKAVDDVSFSIYKGETLGLVGESGCGKSTLGKCIVRLPIPTEGKIFLNEQEIGMKNVLSLDKRESFSARRRVQMVFQDPYASLNPRMNIYHAFDEPMRIHGIGDRRERKEKIARALETVNLQPDYMYRYPHEFSGGQRQRICIAKALALNPEMMVCDEPVSALDVSIQAQLMNLMRKLQREFQLTYIFIAHDLSVVQYMSDRVAVMYLGKIVELADSGELYRRQVHPYTRALLSAVPSPVLQERRGRIILKGDVPSPANPPAGCRFHTRCEQCREICTRREPELKPLKTDEKHLVACHFAEQP